MIDSNLSRSRPAFCTTEDPIWINHPYAKMEICKTTLKKNLENKRLLVSKTITLPFSEALLTSAEKIFFCKQLSLSEAKQPRKLTIGIETQDV